MAESELMWTEMDLEAEQRIQELQSGIDVLCLLVIRVMKMTMTVV